jgi:hypothetical protein
VHRPLLVTTYTESCSSFTCTSANLDLYPTTQSGLLCSGSICNASVTLNGSLVTADLTTPVAVAACRNAACGSVTLPLPVSATDGGGELPSQAMIDAGFPAQVGIGPGTGHTYPIQVLRMDETAALADGDVYSFTVTQGARPLLMWSGPVKYTTTWSNGSSCDPFPCRTATIIVP